MKIDLIQPRHNYAPIEGLGHVYMPTSLLTVGARLLNAGVDVKFHDENLGSSRVSSMYIGFNLLGEPYIPEVIKLQEKINNESSEEITFLVGGQVVSGLSKEQLKRLFGNSTYNGNNEFELSRVLGIDINSLAPSEKTSLIPAYKKLDDEVMKEYLSREFSLYVSQGCKFACDFCAAVRTYKDPETGQTVKAIESYRELDIIQADLNYLVGRAKSFGLDKLQLYMSNLDVFQTPQQLLRFAYAVQEVRKSNPNFTINLRGLATVDSFLRARDYTPKSIEELVNAGFSTVGFGVDGWTKEVWAAVKKGHNTEEKCLEAIRSAKEDFGITPEILMVFGHPTADKEESLRAAYQVTAMVVEKYGAVPRPHVSKDFIPGNTGWRSPEHAEAVEMLLKHPESFQSLDFTSLPSSLTHPDDTIRELTADYFLKMCSLPGDTTQYVKPITPDLTPEELERVRRFNEGRFDR